MTRPFLLAFTAMLMSGCAKDLHRLDYAKVHPIYGRQTIPAQRTGTAGSLTSKDYSEPPPKDYYNSGSSDGRTAPAAPSSSTTSGGDNNYSPPGGSYDFNGSSNRTAPAAPKDGSASDSGWVSRPGRTVSSGSFDSPSGGSSPPIRATNPDDWPSRYENRNPRQESSPSSGSGTRNDDGGSAAADRNDGPFRTAHRSRRTSARGTLERDIMDLPRRSSLSGAASRKTGPVRNASYETSDRQTKDLRSDNRRIAEPAGQSRRYGHDSNYRWLLGRLEYSHLHRRWKLRYIPISGDTDKFGGSVILQDLPALRNFKPGEFVRVEGSLHGDKDRGSLAPMFQADRISPAG